MPNSVRIVPVVLTMICGLPALAHDEHFHHPPSAGQATGSSFDAEMGEAMERMHSNMMVPPSGDPDRDFAVMMIPHHQGAVDMARIQLQYGKDPVLRRLAQGIIVEQLQEIDVMKRRLKELPPSTQPASSHDKSNQDHWNNDNKGALK